MLCTWFPWAPSVLTLKLVKATRAPTLEIQHRSYQTIPWHLEKNLHRYVVVLTTLLAPDRGHTA